MMAKAGVRRFPAVPEKWYFCRKFCLLNIKQKLSATLQTIFPSTRAELLIFLISFVIYSVLGYTIAWHYRIIFDDRIPWDAYFSFDNRAIVMTGGGYERHPLANYFFDGIRELALLISSGQKDAYFRLTLAFCSNLAVSLSLVQIFKYLTNIIRLPLSIALLILTFFGFFSTPILLSFTPETYTYTLFFLVLFNYYAALKLRKQETIPAVALTLAAISVGGLTITNILKVYIPVLFEKGVFRRWQHLWKAAARVMISVVVFALLFLYRMDFKVMHFFNKSAAQYEKFSNPKVIPVWDMILSWFFGGNMLLSSFVVRDYHNKKGFEYKALFMDVYSSVFPYIFVGVVLMLVIWSYVRNRKNVLAHVLMLSLLLDVIIHCVMKFGLHTAYIYGGHFMFVIPLMIGWLFHSYRYSMATLSALFAVVAVLLLYLAGNNMYRVTEFFIFLEDYYR